MDVEPANLQGPGLSPIRGIGLLESVLIAFVDLPDSMRLEMGPDDLIFEATAFSARWEAVTVDGVACLALATAPSNAGPADGPSILWWYPDPPPILVSSATEDGGAVGLVPADEFEPRQLSTDDEATLQRLLESALYVEPRDAASMVTRLGSRGQKRELVEVTDPGNLAAVLGPVRSRLARARGEFVADKQIVPMQWRPWHFDLVDRTDGLAWVWPQIQITTQISSPSTWNLSVLGEVDSDLCQRLQQYLDCVKRLAESMSLNSEAKVSIRATAADGLEPAQVEGPPRDAFDALFMNLRKLHDPNEGSRFSFLELRSLTSQTAKLANDDDLVAELKRWKDARKALERRSLRDLQLELVEEAGLDDPGESVPLTISGLSEMFSDHFGAWPDLTPGQLIDLYMYGDAVHADAAKASQIDDWDAHPTLGASLRHEAVAAAHRFVHLYGAFAGYVQAWLDVSPTDR